MEVFHWLFIGAQISTFVYPAEIGPTGRPWGKVVEELTLLHF